MPPTRSTVAHVNLAALQANYRAIVTHLADDTKRQPPQVIAVVKANAYGHGAGPVALALEQAGATMLACADIEEGVALRRAGVRVPILVFGALSVSDLDGVLDHALTPTISSPFAARAVEAAAARRGSTIGYHLKIDTGMHRLGFRHDNLARTLPPVLASPHLRLDGVFTHFASADVPESDVFDQQRTRFDAATATLETLGGRPPLRHAANSAALLRDSRVLVRRRAPGVAALRHRAAAAGVDHRPHAGDVADQPRRGGEGAAPRRGRRLRLALHRRRAARRSPSCRPATPTVSTRAWRIAPRCWCAGIARRWSAPSRWT